MTKLVKIKCVKNVDKAFCLLLLLLFLFSFKICENCSFILKNLNLFVINNTIITALSIFFLLEIKKCYSEYFNVVH